VVASAETLAYAVAHGVMGDPRSFKRPVRVTVPRVLPTDDVLVVREKKGEGTDAKRAAPIAPAAAPAWKNGALEVVEPGRAFAAPGPVAVFCPAVDDVRHVALRAQESGGDIRAVLSPFIPSSLVAVLSGAGALAIRVENAPKDLVGKKIDLPAPNQWPEKGSASLAVVQGSGAKLQLEWLATSTERSWVTRTISRKA
jgi:aconitate hydratase